MFDRIKSLSCSKHRRLITIAFSSLAIACGSVCADAQEVAVKTNLLYDATSTPNIGVEIGLGGKSTFNLVYGLNPWKFDTATHGERYAKHWVLMPEYRWWTCSRLIGHFIGLHALGGQLNASNIDLPAPGVFFNGPKLNKIGADSRYQGWYAGGGLTYGYQYPLSDNWNIEAEIGVGYAHMWYDQFPCSECGSKIRNGGTNYVGLTKLGFSIMYVF